MRRQRILLVSTAWAMTLFVSVAQAGKFNKALDVGDPAPKWSELQGIDGKPHALGDYDDRKILILYFTDNHCPASRLYAPRLRAVLREFEKDSVGIVAINVTRGPHESLERMRAHAEKQKWTFDYLRDPTQQVGREYGAVRTPQFFVLDQKRNIAYMGTLDDNDDAEKAQKPFLRDAIRSLLKGERPDPGETLQRGCKIEYEAP